MRQNNLAILVNYFILFICFKIFACTRSSLLSGLFYSWGKQRLLSSCGAQASHCGGFSCCRAWALGCMGSVVVVHRLNCSAACGIFPDQGSNLCLLYWQVNSYPLSHQGNPFSFLFISIFTLTLFSPPHFSFLLALNIFSFPPYSFFPLHL